LSEKAGDGWDLPLRDNRGYFTFRNWALRNKKSEAGTRELEYALQEARKVGSDLTASEARAKVEALAAGAEVSEFPWSDIASSINFESIEERERMKAEARERVTGIAFELGEMVKAGIITREQESELLGVSRERLTSKQREAFMQRIAELEKLLAVARQPVPKPTYKIGQKIGHRAIGEVEVTDMELQGKKWVYTIRKPGTPGEFIAQEYELEPLSTEGDKELEKYGLSKFNKLNDQAILIYPAEYVSSVSFSDFFSPILGIEWEREWTVTQQSPLRTSQGVFAKIFFKRIPAPAARKPEIKVKPAVKLAVDKVDQAKEMFDAELLLRNLSPKKYETVFNYYVHTKGWQDLSKEELEERLKNLIGMIQEAASKKKGFTEQEVMRRTSARPFMMPRGPPPVTMEVAFREFEGRHPTNFTVMDPLTVFQEKTTRYFVRAEPAVYLGKDKSLWVWNKERKRHLPITREELFERYVTGSETKAEKTIEDEAYKMWRQGYSNPYIATNLEMTEQRLAEILKKFGITI